MSGERTLLAGATTHERTVAAAADPVLLLTGFGPFAGVAHNPTAVAVAALNGTVLPDGTRIVGVELPVAFRTAGAALRRAMAAAAPAAVLAAGTAAEAQALRVETTARNTAHARVPDNEGRAPQNAPLDPTRETGEAFTADPGAAAAVLNALVAAGLPAALSNDAGTFVCNALYYALLDRASRDARPPPALFLHVPATDNRDPAGAVWTDARITAAVRTAAAALAACARAARS